MVGCSEPADPAVPSGSGVLRWWQEHVSEMCLFGEMCPFGAGSLKISFEGERRVILVAYDEVYKYLVEKGTHAERQS